MVRLPNIFINVPTEAKNLSDITVEVNPSTKWKDTGVVDHELSVCHS